MRRSIDDGALLGGVFVVAFVKFGARKVSGVSCYLLILQCLRRSVKSAFRFFLVPTSGRESAFVLCFRVRAVIVLTFCLNVCFASADGLNGGGDGERNDRGNADGIEEKGAGGVPGHGRARAVRKNAVPNREMQ